jgi:hypothetical protein
LPQVNGPFIDLCLASKYVWPSPKAILSGEFHGVVFKTIISRKMK